MRGQRIGYVRVSSFDQNPERQLEQSQVDKVFTDKASGKDTQRPQLVVRSVKYITNYATSKLNFFHRKTTGVAFISAIPWRMRALRSLREVTRM